MRDQKPHREFHANRIANIYTGSVISLPTTVPEEPEIDWYSFLERPRFPSPSEAALDNLSEASILITGAGGSIGSALSLRVAQLNPRKLVLLDSSEQSLYRLQSSLKNESLKPTMILGSIADGALLNHVFATHHPQMIFHAAAYKHVPLLEEHPLAAITNNAIGTHTLAECARVHSSRLLLLSTDKAAAPISILGATKRIAELTTLALGGIAIRLGNVLGTEGSVVETFRRQLAAGTPLTITDVHAERYFLTGEEAVDLLLTSATSASPATLLVPRLTRRHTIVSLATFLANIYSPGSTPSMQFTCARSGDKLHEDLWSPDEKPISTHAGSIEVSTQTINEAQLQNQIKQLHEAVNSNNLTRALDIVLELVPDYKPSSTVLTLARQANAEVLQA